MLDLRNTLKKNRGSAKNLQEKILDPQSIHEKIFRTYEGTMTRRHENHQNHDGTRSTESSTIKQKNLV